MIRRSRLQIYRRVAGLLINALALPNGPFSWQDLKDYIRDNARVEPDFCDAHKYEDRIATGYPSFSSFI